MKRFLFAVPVVSAEGTQTWYADAENSDEALEKYLRGECGIYSSDVEVVELGAPELSGETTLNDSGGVETAETVQLKDEIEHLNKAPQDRRLKARLGSEFGKVLAGHWFYLQPADEYASKALSIHTSE